VLTVVIGGGIWLLFPNRTPPGQGAPPKLEVSKERKGAVPTIQQALRKAETGSVIELWDDTIEENVVIVQSSTQRTNITIQAAPGKEVTWRSASNDPKQPILTLNKCADLKLAGERITFDGTLRDKKIASDLIRIMDVSPGLVLEDASFKNFGRSGIYIVNAAGTANKPIQIRKLSSETTDKMRPAIWFDANANMLPKLNDYIHIEAGDYRGHDEPIRFPDGKEVFGDDVRWPGK
jgi:hypothetical protein